MSINNLNGDEQITVRKLQLDISHNNLFPSRFPLISGGLFTCLPINAILFILILILLLISEPLKAALVKGPVTGTVILPDSDKGSIDNLVAQIRCHSSGIHGSHGSGRNHKVISSGETFRFWWTWQGIFPTGCSLYIYHPEYVTAYRHLGTSFSNDVGEIRLMSWKQFLENGPTDPPMHSAYPWPKLEYSQHLRHLLYYYFPAFSEEDYQYLQHFVPYLHQLTDDVLNTGVYGEQLQHDVYSPVKTIRKIETKLDYAGALDKLHAAIKNNRVEDVAAVLKAGVWIVATKPLSYSAGKGNLEIVKLLIEHDQLMGSSRRIFILNDALQAALSENHAEIVALLVHYGADWQKLTSFYRKRLASAFYSLSYKGNVSAMKQLLDAGLNPDISGDSSGVTAIMGAAKKSQLEAAKLLIKYGANTNVRASHNRYALRIAEGKRNKDMIRLLKDHGATHPIKK